MTNTNSIISATSNIFSEPGLIANALPNYELRNEQIEMAKAVEDAILNSETLIAEAGTGVGKSFSYLIPIAQYVLETERLAVISTNTISLQEQIIHKDIPFLEKALGIDCKATLVKGKHNYLCLRRVHRSNLKQKDLFADEYEMKQFAKIVAWSYKTEDGSLYDLDEDPDSKVWDMVSANTENCLGKACPYYKQCFFQKARDKITSSRILVVNHHLFFSNLAMQEEQKAIIPEYDVLVFDEAHSIENVATKHMGTSVSSSGIKHLMDILFNPQKQKGFLFTIEDQNSMEWVELIRKRSDEFFKDIKEYFNAKKKSLESDSLRIRNLDFAKNTLSPTLIKLVESLLGAKKRAKNKEDEIEISAHIRKINALNNSIDVILNQALDNYVYWIESSRNRRSNNISINAAPINIGEILRSRLFASSTPIILTSATLSINDGSFKYFKDRVGIKEARELQLGSPFDYRNQVRMYIARNMPLPNNFTEYASQAAEKIKRYIKLTNGNAFVLFTSYSLMNSVYEDLEDYFIEEGINVLKQGSGIGRSKMLENFKKESGSVLFGVDSFWQGIDVQGESLSNVIITKLPFAVPDHPIIQSRIEEIEKGGGDAFLEYNLPEAILRFKQGFGRLIRSKKDTGIIVILDSRVLKKSYGRQFLNSIPKCEVFIDN